MKTLTQIREEYLAEGKIGITKLKAGDKVQILAKGSLAKRSGFKKGDNPYGIGSKVQILGFGVVPHGDKANKKYIIAKSIDDFKKKYKPQIKDLRSDYDYDRGLSQYNAAGKLRILANDIANGLKMKYGFVGFIYQVIDGEYKGDLRYMYVSDSIWDKWAIYWSDDMEFDVIT